MLIKIKPDFWIDLDDVRLIISDKENGLKIFYKSQSDFTIIPEELKVSLLNECALYHGHQIIMKDPYKLIECIMCEEKYNPEEHPGLTTIQQYCNSCMPEFNDDKVWK